MWGVGGVEGKVKKGVGVWGVLKGKMTSTISTHTPAAGVPHRKGLEMCQPMAEAPRLPWVELVWHKGTVLAPQGLRHTRISCTARWCMTI